MIMRNIFIHFELIGVLGFWGFGVLGFWGAEVVVERSGRLLNVIFKEISIHNN